MKKKTSQGLVFFWCALGVYGICEYIYTFSYIFEKEIFESVADTVLIVGIIGSLVLTYFVGRLIDSVHSEKLK